MSILLGHYLTYINIYKPINTFLFYFQSVLGSNNSLLTSLLITVDTMVCVPRSPPLSASLEMCMCVHVHTHVQERSVLNDCLGRESILSNGSLGGRQSILLSCLFPCYFPPCSAVHSLSIMA